MIFIRTFLVTTTFAGLLLAAPLESAQAAKPSCSGALTQVSTAEALRVQIQREQLIPRLFLVTHQKAPLQAETGELLRQDAIFRDVPRLALVSGAFPLSDSQLAREISLFMVSADGGFGGAPVPVASEVYLAGGYCEYCLGRTAQELIHAVRQSGLRDLKLTFLTNYVYSGRGGSYAQLLRREAHSLAEKVELTRESMLPKQRLLKQVASAPPTLDADGKIFINWYIPPSSGLSALNLHVVLDPR